MMNILLFNFLWMSFNIFLAILAVILGQLLNSTNKKFLIGLYLILWILFLPNTLYLFTDLINLIKQWSAATQLERAVFVLQYGILQIFGVFTSIYSLFSFEVFLRRILPKNRAQMTVPLILFINTLVGFGIVLGRVQRINSWEAFTNPKSVFYASIGVISSFNLFMLFVLFSLFANLFYFVFKDIVRSFFKTCLGRVGFLK